MSEVPYIGTDNKVDSVRTIEMQISDFWNRYLNLKAGFFLNVPFSVFCRNATFNACQLKSVCKYFLYQNDVGNLGN